VGDISFGLFVEFFDAGEFLLGGGGVAGGLVGAAEAVVRVGLFRIEFDSAFQRGDSFLIFSLLIQDGAQINVGEANVFADVDGFFEKGEGGGVVVILHGHVAEIGERLGVGRTDGQLFLELGFGLIVLLELPVEIAEAEMHVWLVGSGFGGGFKFGDGVERARETV